MLLRIRSVAFKATIFSIVTLLLVSSCSILLGCGTILLIYEQLLLLVLFKEEGVQLVFHVRAHHLVVDRLLFFGLLVTV